MQTAAHRNFLKILWFSLYHLTLTWLPHLPGRLQILALRRLVLLVLALVNSISLNHTPEEAGHPETCRVYNWIKTNTVFSITD